MFRETVDDAHLTNNDLPSSIRMITFGVDDRQLEGILTKHNFLFLCLFFTDYEGNVRHAHCR